MTDAKFIAFCEKACFGSPWNIEAIEATMDSGYCVYAIIPDVGYVLGQTAFGDADLYRIGVLPEKRRAHAGDELMRQFIDACREQGAQHILLEVRSKNLPAVSLYKKHGFEQIYVRKRYYDDDDALVMELKLSSGGN